LSDVQFSHLIQLFCQRFFALIALPALLNFYPACPVGPEDRTGVEFATSRDYSPGGEARIMKWDYSTGVALKNPERSRRGATSGSPATAIFTCLRKVRFVVTGER
jgi:hypothetical protein